ncbi:hypothetical protein HAP41_0000049460 (plasmid) [Bradyrhizobium barranii subsp. apii]|uniref:Uncharacterized protein n=1 Tax=Bradyrhizobium barranii subsp. apii TaxID=2819348 RepID=A0A8T5VS64_9BRAD|nr:hypothetical protein [Bradyrhizobium barranii]UPT92478.1 hypothetical protein HAP41_0000049460 [Bradyrhizobium barranii subsp. apii]
MPDKSDLAYSAIGAAFSDDDIKDLVKRSTGIPITDLVGERDPPKKKIEKVVEFLRDRGNQRWLLTRVMFHATAGDMVRQKIVDAFPETLIGLPKAGDHVTRALAYLSKVLSVPLPREVKYRLLPSRRSFARMPKCVIALFAYKTLQECLLRLLFTLNANEALLANRAEGVTPELRSVADHIDQAIEQVPQTLSLLDADSPPISEGELAKLEQFAASLRTSADAPENAVVVIENLQRLVRRSLSQLNNDIFKLVQDLSFDALTDELPSRLQHIQDSTEFQELVQAIRDVTATILARSLKSRMWQDAEANMALISKYFILPDDVTSIADDWLTVRERIDWLAALEPDEGWADEAKKYALEIDNEFCREKKLDDNVRLHFEAYRAWFRGPFLKIDDTTRMDFGSLYLLGGPFRQILNELSNDPRTSGDTV